mgnify:FL=1
MTHPPYAALTVSIHFYTSMHCNNVTDNGFASHSIHSYNVAISDSGQEATHDIQPHSTFGFFIFMITS